MQIDSTTRLEEIGILSDAVRPYTLMYLFSLSNNQYQSRYIVYVHSVYRNLSYIFLPCLRQLFPSSLP